MTTLDIAIRIAENSFKDKVDKSGQPYYNHIRRVYDGVIDHNNVYAKIVAMLHDLLEDCPEWNEESLRCIFSDEIVDAVVAITRLKGEDYGAYIDRVSKNEISTIVKISDLEDNMRMSRLPTIEKRDIDRMLKYHKAYTFLKSKNE